MRIAVAGGGAAGFFGAITCAESIPDAEVVLLEKSPELLAKVIISGGGRCNVTHACFEPEALVARYPRGARELLGPFHRWQPRDTVDWFASRGVALKKEADGRMFPVTDRSSTIADCLRREADRAGVRVQLRHGLKAASPRAGGGLDLQLANGATLACDRLLLATGGNQNSTGYAIAASLGHTIEPPVPSLFTFNIRDARLDGLAGISVPEAEVSVPSCRLRQRGPLLVTHWGLSGPAILRLSAWGARVLHDLDYRFDLHVNWLPSLPAPELLAALQAWRAANPRRAVLAASPFPALSARLWRSLAAPAAGEAQRPWGQLGNESLQRLARDLGDGVFRASGKSINKDEFVTCGGERVREVDFRTMARRL